MGGMMTSFSRLAMLIALMALPALAGQGAAAQPVEERCAGYATQAEAQAAFDADPGAMRDLDDDADGIACEHLPTGVVTDDGMGLLPWIAAGVIVAGAGAGAIILRRFTGCAVPYRRPHGQPPSPAPPVVAPDRDEATAVEIDLAALKAERQRARGATTPGQEP
jgi:hypothetical protein